MTKEWINKHGIATKPMAYIDGFYDGYHGYTDERMQYYEDYRDGRNDGYKRQLEEERDRLLSCYVPRVRAA